MSIKYSPVLEEEMRRFYKTLSERDKRRYAGIEALKLGHGGIGYMAEVLGCSPKTVSQGIKEVEHLPEESQYDPRVRKPGGGRKRSTEIHPELEEQFLDVVKDYTAGDPMHEEVVWTNLTPREISDRLKEKHGVSVSTFVIRKLLRKHNYRRRKAQKQKTMKAVAHREEQFEHIAQLKREYEAAGNPIISIDTKKKEYLGNYYREGHLYTQGVIETFDHDFNSFADGVVIPYGIYDLQQNIGYITLGTSKDTSQFACDCIRNWWVQQGQYDYPNPTSILTLCDGGGSNSSRTYLFKAELQKLVQEIGVEIRVAHYPAYCSKYNPIEHRLFPHVTRACQGVIFKTIDIVKELMEKATTKTGLKVIVHILEKIYHTGRKASEALKKSLNILFEDPLPNWNYRVVPLPSK